MTTTTDTNPTSPVTGEAPKIPLIVGTLMLAMLMSSLGQMIFSTALPTIVGELGGVNHMSWVITAFLLGQTISLPIFGKLGDQLGRKYLFMGVVALFMAGSLVGGLANSMAVLIFARAMQGVAGGGMMILSQSITAEVVSARERGKYMGIMGSVFGVSSVLGPVLGGWFTDGPGWRWGLWLNVPLGLLTLIGIAIFLKLPKRPRQGTFDYLGATFMASATTCLILLVTWGGNEYAWTSPTILGLIAGTIILGAVFVIVELRAKNPLVPMSYFRNRNFVLTTIASLAIGVFMFGALGYLPTYLQMVHSLTPTNAGLMMIPMMVGLMGTSILTGNLVSRTGKYKRYPIAGLLITAVGMVLLSLLDAHDSLYRVGLDFFVFGVGLGSAMQILTLIVQNSFPITQVGTATGANNFFRQIGGSLGAALVGGLFTSRLTSSLADSIPAALQQMGPAAAPFAENFSSGSGSHRLTPGLVSQLPEVLRSAIQISYNDALTPIFLILMPLAVLSAAVLVFVTETELKETIS
ncbi:MDR family MFS transporter [Corynebacterium epidermidicanis]|uniref:Drug resistance transporter, EmrB/QacA subfamily n=1 Tax=Corynebacterium epidermidicanis TaxID=1050174 RepID=A0A0G3GNH2_9CORY|nr:MDR family MFS transporter [Corynebacterium epidermidicanis]AKK02761.1 drug resistance transporter, EmrB/QacA subfamily [Corynebacterium epidermidicanis]